MITHRPRQLMPPPSVASNSSVLLDLTTGIKFGVLSSSPAPQTLPGSSTLNAWAPSVTPEFAKLKYQSWSPGVPPSVSAATQLAPKPEPRSPLKPPTSVSAGALLVITNVARHAIAATAPNFPCRADMFWSLSVGSKE